MLNFKWEHLLIVNLEKGEIWLADELLRDKKLVKKFKPSRVPNWMVILSRMVKGERVPYSQVHAWCGEKRELLIKQFLENVNKKYGTTFCLVWLRIVEKSFGHEVPRVTLGLANKVSPT